METKIFNFKARWLLVPLVLMTLGVGSVWGETITFSQSTTGITTTSYPSGTQTETISNVEFSWINIIKSGSNLQLRASTGEVWNSTLVPGKITNVSTTNSGTSRTSTLYWGTTAKPTVNSSNISGTSSTNSPANSCFGYIHIKRGSNAQIWTQMVITYTPATITLGKTSITGLDYTAGSGPSSSGTFTVSGSNIPANLTITAPTNFEVSLDGSSWGSSKTINVTLTNSANAGTLSSTTVYVRLASGKSTGDYSGNVSIAMDGCNTISGVNPKTLAVSGTVSSASCTTQPTVGSSLTSVSATVNSITATVLISAIGGCNITENGLVYSTSNSTPTVGGTNCTKVTTTACGSTAANKTVTISDLTCGTPYYVRGYATNTAGTSYTNVTTQSTSACPKYTVTLKDDNSTLTQASAGASVTLPSRTGCTDYTFAGWTKTWIAPQSSWTTTAPTIIPAGSYTPSANENLYPVYTKTEGGSGAAVGTTMLSETFEDFSLDDYPTAPGTNSITYSNSITYTCNPNESSGTRVMTSGGPNSGSGANNIIVKSGGSFSIGNIPTGSATTLTFSCKVGGSKTLTITSTSSDVTLGSNTGTSAERVYTLTVSNNATSFGLSFAASGGNMRLDDISIVVATTSAASTTYYISEPNCCTPLGTINGSVTLTNEGCGAGELKATWKMLATTGIASQTLRVYDENLDEVTAKRITDITASTSNQTKTISGLNPCKEYYVTVENVSSGGEYCAAGDPWESDVVTTLGYTYTITKENVSLKAGETEAARSCDDFMAEYVADTGYDLPTTITVTGASSYEWDEGVLSIDKANVTGNVTVTITGTAQSTSYQLWTAWANGNNCEGDICNTWDWTGGAYFTQVGTSHEWQITNYTIPAFEWDATNQRQMIYNVAGKNPTNTKFYDLAFAVSQGTSNIKKGPMPGAVGTLRMYDNYGDPNGYLGFLPNNYMVRFGTHDYIMTETSSNVWETAIQTLDATDLTNASKYRVGCTNSSDEFVAINEHCPETAVTSMGQKSGETTWGSNLAAGDAGKRGKFRIWVDNATANWTCHFVPYHRVVFHSNYQGGGGPADTYAGETSVESSNASIALNPAPTAPTGYTFDGWYDAAIGGNKITTPRSIAAGASADIELYAHWTANTISLILDKNNSDVSGSSNGSGTIVFDGNATATITGAIRTGHTVEGYYSDAACTAANKVLDANGNVINSTVSGYTTSGKWTCAATPTTLFTKWTAETFTVTWYAGGSADGNIVSTENVDYGQKVASCPADPDGSPCDKVFVGWTNTTTYTHGTSLLFTDVAGSPVINTDASFYAVFAEVNSVSASLTKMTDDDDLEVGDKIVIIAQDTRYGMYQASASSYVSYWTTTDVDGEPSLSEIEADDKKYLDVAAGGVTDTWKLGDATNGYLYNSSSTNLEFSTTNSSDLTLIKWTDDSFTLQAGQYISCRTDITGANANKWRGAGSSCNPETGNNCSGTEYYYLYKYVPGGTTATGHTINCTSCANSVTVSYSAPGSGNTMSVTKSSTPIASGTSVKTCSAQSLTVTLTPAPHYTVTNFAATGVTGVTTTNVGNVYTVNIPADATGTLTLTPTFTPETPLTITFDVSSVSGVTAGDIGTIYNGDSFTFPNVSGVPGGFCADFLGWVDFTNGETFDGDGTRTTAPTELIAVGANSGTITTNKTYKAVYGVSESSEAEGYFKVTAAPEAPATWANDHYLIVYEGDATHDAVAFKGSLSTLDAVKDTAHVTITAGVIAYSAALAACEFKIAAITGGYSIQSASGVYIGKAAYSNGMDESTSEAAVNTLSYTSGATVIAGAGGCVLNYNYASDQLRFRYYKTGQQDIQLYKYGTAPVVTYTYTTAPSCGTKYRVTVASVSGGSPAVSPKYCADGTTVSLVANANNGYNFTSWTITKDGTNPLEDVTSTLLGANSTVASTSFTMPDYDVTITPAYAIINYNITYNNLNGATNSNPATYNVASADIVFVAPGERSGYVFKGWYDDNVYTNAVTGIPNGSTGAVTVYAKWATGYTITWDNAIGSNPTSTGVEDGDPIGPLPTPTGSCSVDGTTYSNFVGWYTGTISGVGTAASDAGTEVTGATTPGSDVTYHAVYTNMPDYSDTHTSNVTLPEQDTDNRIYRFKAKISDADDAEQYDAVKLGKSSPKTASFTITVPAGTTALTLHAVGWATTATLTVSTAAEGVTITPSAAQSLTVANASASDGTVYSSYNTFKFNLSGASSATTLTISNANERVMIWGINASSASGENVGYITQCCDNMLAAPTVTGTANSSTQITLSWTAVSGATGYKVSWNGGDWEDISTATSYVKTGLDPAETYSWKVMGKYNPASKCGAETASGTTTTKSVYHVTYVGGSGTGTCTASHVPTDNTAYEAGQTVTLPATSGEGAISLTGHQFAAWTSEQVALTASSTSFVMPESDVTVTAIWTAKVDKYYDNMHDLTATDPVTGDPGTQDGAHYYITREGCKYTVPSLSDNTTGATACHTTHYVLMGWVAASYMKGYPNNMDGTITEANKEHIFTGGGEKSATGATYYAVWAIVTE